MAAGYVLAWYTVLALVVAALRPTDRLARWVALQGGLITAAFLIPRSDLSSKPLVGHFVWFYVPFALTAGFVWAVYPFVAKRRGAIAGATPDRTNPTATV